MSYLVDGNNVMAQRVGWHRDRPRARRALLDELARFAARKRVSVAVVFDGAPEDHFPEGSSYRGVRLHYAERGSDADSRIKTFVEAARERRTLRVVTSDRALADYVRRCGVEVLRSGEFRRMMESVGAAGAAAGEVKREIEGDTAHWMRYFGVAPEDDE
ncbi:MAG TPA: NYN domain-containing protein [Pyrinomonadaceae bacterium]|jgi:predicted RNA-binding protein with PIN domain|nr:NYN domain-containing protein [Pyrinomonadaceae bacterium]